MNRFDIEIPPYHPVAWHRSRSSSLALALQDYNAEYYRDADGASAAADRMCSYDDMKAV